MISSRHIHERIHIPVSGQYPTVALRMQRYFVKEVLYSHG